MINTYCIKSLINRLIPRLAFGTSFFTSPLIASIITDRIRPFLNNKLLIRSHILESCICHKATRFLFRFWFCLVSAQFLYVIKSCECSIHRAVGSWSWDCSISCWEFLLLSLMFFSPIFIAGFIHPYFYNSVMRIVCATARCFIT